MDADSTWGLNVLFCGKRLIYFGLSVLEKTKPKTLWLGQLS